MLSGCIARRIGLRLPRRRRHVSLDRRHCAEPVQHAPEFCDGLEHGVWMYVTLPSYVLARLIHCWKSSRDLHRRLDKPHVRNNIHGPDRVVQDRPGHPAMDDVCCLPGIQCAYGVDGDVWESVFAAY
jgi:hypothetical protein